MSTGCFNSVASSLESAISDEFLGLLGAAGEQSAASAGIERYRQAGASSPCIGAIPGAEFNPILQAAIG